MAKYQIITDSSCDLTTEIRKEYNIQYFYFGLVVDGKEYHADLDWVDYTSEEFYGWLKEGRKVKTTQVSMEECIAKCRPLFEQGIDVIYLGCSSALTGSMNLFELAKQELLEEFPDRKMIGIDTLTSSATLGMLCVDAAKQRDAGLSIEELQQWVEDHKFLYNQWATVDSLKWLREAGRVKAGAAFFGDVFGVKPIIISDRKGNNFTTNKVRGTKASLDALFNGVKDTLMKEHCSEIYVGHGNCEARAKDLAKRLEEELEIKVTVTWIGPIIGATCGPGIIAVFTRGKEVTRYEGDGVQE